MYANSILPARGSVLLYGAPSQHQSDVAFDIACQVGLEHPAVYLCDDARQAEQVTERAGAWRYARQIPLGQRLRVSGVSIHGASGRDLVHRIFDATTSAAPSLIVRDLALRMNPLGEFDPWRGDASALAECLRCVVLTVGHVGQQGALDVAAVAADEVWRSLTYHDKARQSGMNVRLVREKPAGGDAVSLIGRVQGRIIVFDPAEDAPPLPRDPLDMGGGPHREHANA